MSGTELQLPETMHIEDTGGAPPEQTPEPARNPRDVMMEQIARRYEQRQAAEIAAGDEMLHEAAEHDRAVAEAAGDPDAGPGRHQQQPQQPTHRTINLQGQAFQVTPDQYQHLAEIGALANLAMEQQRNAAPPQQPPPVAQQAQAPAYVPHRGAPLLAADEAREIVQKLSYGSSEDGIEAVQQLAANIAARQQIDPAQLGAYATQQALATIQFQQNLAQIGQEFPDVFNDQTRAYVAAIELTQLRQRDALIGHQRPDIEQYREACQRVRNALLPQRGGRGEAIDRLERKRAAPRNPMAVSRSAGFATESSRPPSASQIVDQMRRARGQMV